MDINAVYGDGKQTCKHDAHNIVNTKSRAQHWIIDAVKTNKTTQQLELHRRLSEPLHHNEIGIYCQLMRGEQLEGTLILVRVLHKT